MEWTLGDGIPAGSRSFLQETVQSGAGAHSYFYSVDTGFISRELNGWGVELTSHLELVPRLNVNGAIRLLPPHTLVCFLIVNVVN